MRQGQGLERWCGGTGRTWAAPLKATAFSARRIRFTAPSFMASTWTSVSGFSTSLRRKIFLRPPAPASLQGRHDRDAETQNTLSGAQAQPRLSRPRRHTAHCLPEPVTPRQSTR